MTTATMLQHPQSNKIGAPSAPVESGPGICACLESLRHTVDRLHDRAAELEMQLSYILPAVPRTTTLADVALGDLPADLPPAVAEILSIERRLLSVVNTINRLSEDVAV
jgi:hypothetical protein